MAASRDSSFVSVAGLEGLLKKIPPKSVESLLCGTILFEIIIATWH